MVNYGSQFVEQRSAVARPSRMKVRQRLGDPIVSDFTFNEFHNRRKHHRSITPPANPMVATKDAQFLHNRDRLPGLAHKKGFLLSSDHRSPRLQIAARNAVSRGAPPLPIATWLRRIPLWSSHGTARIKLQLLWRDPNPPDIRHAVAVLHRLIILPSGRARLMPSAGPGRYIAYWRARPHN